MKKVIIVNGGYDYFSLFQNLGMGVARCVDEAALVCFTGGADVSPAIYGDSKHPYTMNDPMRDREEAIIFKECAENGIPMVGICRGGQFLNVMNGGRMYQDVRGHTRPHLMKDARTGEELLVSSTHHQMMMPSSEAVLVASASLHEAREWLDGDIHQHDVSDCDIEVVYYPKYKSLCFQPHPEFTGKHYVPMQDYFGSLLKEFCNV